MDILAKILAVFFSILTALGVIPGNIPRTVVLDPVSKEETVVS